MQSKSCRASKNQLVYNTGYNNSFIINNQVMQIEMDALQFDASGKNANIAWRLLDSQAQEIILADSRGNVLFANKTALSHKSFSCKAISGDSIWNFFPTKHKNHMQLLFNQVIVTQKPQSLKYRDGNQWFQTLFSPFVGENNHTDKIGLITHDITQQTFYEEQLKRTILELATAQEDERHRISRDLHDEIGQRMTVMLLQLRSFKEIIKNDRKVGIEDINSVSQNLEIIIKHLRQIFFQLYPPSLSKVSLPKVLDALCISVMEANGLKIDLSCQEEMPDLLENQVTTIYRFVQEGLTNVVKHSRATSAWINLDYSDGEINISIEDDGVGFETQMTGEGVGLRGIRERFILLNGSFEIDTSISKGTRLSGSIPLNAKTLRVKI